MKLLNDLLKSAIVAGVALGASTAVAQDNLYSNTENPANVDFSVEEGGVEFGDQIQLAFPSEAAPEGEFYLAELESLLFQYFADVSTDARLRVYNNNGDQIALGDGTFADAPGDVIFDSGTFALPAAVGNTVTVPLNGGAGTFTESSTVTWSIEFATPFAGLSLAGPPEIGNGFTDFWRKDADSWKLENVTGQADSSFQAIVTGSVEAVPEPSTIALGVFAGLMFVVRGFRRKA